MTERSKYVRWANVNDAAHLVALNTAFNGAGVTAEDVAKSLENTSGLVAVAILDEVPVGFACAQYFKSFCYHEAQGEITEMYIEESARRKGLAAMLISFLEERLREKGVRSIKILTGQHNLIAQKSYERSKYILEDEVVFQKDLF
ncbi:GNAT family N-acetyltransferase [Paenibacillus sp. GCM10027626]|uniref:GNAT family N-acetyltransferase n=1 Tax=Paenibacillus sp. GCM10027626 TaxID=3273411 RepID=UPI00362E68CC